MVAATEINEPVNFPNEITLHAEQRQQEDDHPHQRGS
jgi:hypothetical protein